MNDVFVTCTQNGRSDQFGMPLVSGNSYTLPWSLARALWLSGYVSVTNTSIFDGGDRDVYRSNLSEELALTNSPVTLFQSGIPFVRFGGDGGSGGLLFTGAGGGFTLSAAITTSNCVFAHGYGYLPANAGALGNEAGWFYFSMTSDTAGVIYNNSYDPSSGVPPAVPVSPFPFPNATATRLSQTSSEITALEIVVPSGNIGPNGLFRVLSRMIATQSANVKRFRIRMNGNEMVHYYPTTTPSGDVEHVVQMAGSLSSQISTKHSSIVSAVSGTLFNDISAYNLSGNVTLSITMQVPSAPSEHMALIVRQLTLTKGV